MESNKKGGRWLFGLPLLICLPCLLPVFAAAFLAAGGVGAIGSFLGGSAGPLALAVGALLLAGAAGTYLWSRLRKRRTSFSLLVDDK